MQDENQNNPGAVIQPSAPVDTPPPQPQKPLEPEAAEPTSSATPTPPTEDAKPVSPDTKPNWQYHDDAKSDGAPPVAVGAINPVNWTASEFIEHSKGFGWYAMLAVGAAVLAAIVYLLTKDKISAGVVVFVALIFGIIAARKPRELNYQVDQSGIQIGEKNYPYEHFKSFAVIQENAIESIWLMPLKRFMPILTIYFDPNDEQKIADVLGAYLPLEDHEMDPVDKLMHKIRF